MSETFYQFRGSWKRWRSAGDEILVYFLLQVSFLNCLKILIETFYSSLSNGHPSPEISVYILIFDVYMPFCESDLKSGARAMWCKNARLKLLRDLAKIIFDKKKIVQVTPENLYQFRGSWKRWRSAGEEILVYFLL